MPGNRLGGLKAAATNKERHGKDFYKRIGRQGGRAGNTGGFYGNSKRAKEAGAIGGRIGKRGRKLIKKEGLLYTFITTEGRIIKEIISR
jgi:hypothetical protein|nr:MAG TPA: Small hydrophilic plant seed protein [Caudoviricetes sp.]